MATTRAPHRPLLPAGRSALDGVVVVLGAIWTGAVMLGARGGTDTALDTLWPALLAAVTLALVLASLWVRPRAPRWLSLATSIALTVTAAVVAALVLPRFLYLAAMPAGIAAGAALAARHPVPTFFVAFLLAGVHASVEVLTPVPAGTVANLALAGLWLGLVTAWITGRREPPRWFAPALVLFGLYLALCLFSVLFAEPFVRGIFAFRISFWFMTAVPLVALAFDRERQQLWLVRAVLLAAGAGVGYALLRWVTGPSATEAEVIREVGTRYVVDARDELRLAGALLSPQALAVWCSAMVPFGVAFALSPGRWPWRVVALAIAGGSVAAIAGTNIRVATAAAGIAVIVVLVLFAASRGHTGRRIVPLTIAVVLLLGGAGAFAANQLANDSGAAERFTGLLDPANDPSVQLRVNKWQSILEDMDSHPLGHGIGASGQAQERYDRFVTAASFTPDSSYVKLAYDQGFLVLALFVLALLAMIVGLAQRAIRAATPFRSALATAGCGVLVAFCVDMAAGEYIEGLQALPVWMLVGLGFAADRSAAGPGLSLYRES